MSADGSYAPKSGMQYSQSTPSVKSTQNGIVTGEDFPQLCETCMGNNPYVRMTKLPFGSKLCKITQQPYQAFRWKAGTNGRHKETMVKIDVAQHRNICQACLNDMQYGLPVGVRDKLLRDGQLGNEIQVPKSDIGQAYFYGQQQSEREIVASAANLNASQQLTRFSQNLMLTNTSNPPLPSGHVFTGSGVTAVAAAAIAKSARATAFRNLPRLCSFWALGTCTRVARKLCPYRPCCGSFAFPELAGSHKELCQSLVKRLEAEGPETVMRTLEEEVRVALKASHVGINKEDAIRMRVQGTDELSKTYLHKIKDGNTLIAPSDPEASTLWVGSVDTDVEESDLVDVFYPFGLVNIRFHRTSNCAFINFASRQGAEQAAENLHGSLFIRGKSLPLNWAKPQLSRLHDKTSNNNLSNVSQSSNLHHGFGTDANMWQDQFLVPPPPGLEKAPLSVYSLPGVNIPAMLPQSPSRERLEEPLVTDSRSDNAGSSRVRENDDIQGEAQKRHKGQPNVSQAMAALSNYDYSDDE